MPARFTIAVLAACILSAASAFTLESPANIIKDRSSIGGWALGGGFTGACPASTTECKDLYGTCCPSGSMCSSRGNFQGVACCPSSTSCDEVLASAPTCANSTWTLYKARGSFFCCEPDQKAVIENSGHIVNIVGVCVPGDQPVASSNLATPVATPSPTASGSVASASATPTLSSTVSSIAAATTTAAASPTSNTSAGSSTAASLMNILIPIVGMALCILQ